MVSVNYEIIQLLSEVNTIGGNYAIYVPKSIILSMPQQCLCHAAFVYGG